MANVKISALPSYTGSAADLRWFVMNNSGETTTYKYSGYSSPFRYTNDTFSSNNTYDTNVLPGSYNKIIGGFNHTLNGNYNAVIGGYGHTFPNQYSTNNFVGGGLSHTLEGGDRHGIIGGSGNYFYGGEQNYGVGGVSNQIYIGNNIGIIGGEYCSVYTGFGTKHNGIYNGAYNKIIDDAKDYNTIINGSGNTISGTSYYSSIINGSGNTIGSYSNVIMLSCSGRTADASNTTYVEKMKAFRGVVELTDGTNTINPGVKSALVMGTNNTISSTSNFNYLIMGQDNTINATVGSAPFAMVFGLGSSVSAFGGVCFGGYSSAGGERAFRWGNNGNSNGTESFSWGEQVNVNGTRSFGFGSYMTITPDYSYSFGPGNSITTSTPYQGIFGSENNLISSTGGNNFIFGSKASTISGTTSGATMVGCSNKSATRNDATFVENLVVFNYAGLNFADDTAAAAGGVVLGQVYHNNGAMRIRIV